MVTATAGPPRSEVCRAVLRSRLPIKLEPFSHTSIWYAMAPLLGRVVGIPLSSTVAFKLDTLSILLHGLRTHGGVVVKQRH